MRCLMLAKWYNAEKSPATACSSVPVMHAKVCMHMGSVERIGPLCWLANSEGRSLHCHEPQHLCCVKPAECMLMNL